MLAVWKATDYNQWTDDDEFSSGDRTQTAGRRRYLSIGRHCALLDGPMIPAKNRTHEDSTATPEMLEILEARGVGRPRRLSQGEVLFLQDAPVELVYFVKRGRVKSQAISEAGKGRAFGIWGRGHTLGLTAFVLGQNHLFVATAWDDVELLAVTPDELARLLRTDPEFVMAVLYYMARFVEVFQRDVEALSFLDAPARVRRILQILADQHGHETTEGLHIDLRITHEEIAELTSADRSTVTTFLNELKRQGYLWTVGRQIVLLPPDHIRILENLAEAVSLADSHGARVWAERALGEGIDLAKVFDVLARSLQSAESRFRHDGLTLPQVEGAMVALEAATLSLKNQIREATVSEIVRGTVLIGVPEGRSHEAGRRILAGRLALSRFRVIDLGPAIPLSQFLERVSEYPAALLAIYPLFALDPAQVAGIKSYVEGADLADRIHIMFGQTYKGGERPESGLRCYVCDMSEAYSLVHKLTEAS
jgi:CRP/FNR family transcriptional regulator